MTWEWAAIIIVLIICATIIYESIRINQDLKSDLDVQPLYDRISALEAAHEEIAKLAAEAKKMHSENQLAMGFKPRGMG